LTDDLGLYEEQAEETDFLALSDTEVRILAARMLSEVGLSHPVAVDALLDNLPTRGQKGPGTTTKREAAHISGMNYDMFCRQMKMICQTPTAQAFRRYVETN
jgi:hypothetical protein